MDLKSLSMAKVSKLHVGETAAVEIGRMTTTSEFGWRTWLLIATAAVVGILLRIYIGG